MKLYYKQILSEDIGSCTKIYIVLSSNIILFEYCKIDKFEIVYTEIPENYAYCRGLDYHFCLQDRIYK